MSERTFDLNKLLAHFEECMSIESDNDDEDDVVLEHYVLAFDELCRLLSSLGTVFSFVEKDVVEKTAILRQLYTNDAEGNYASIRRMILYECFPFHAAALGSPSKSRKAVEENGGSSSPAVQSGCPKPQSGKEGARTVLRLHRALNFLIEFVREIHAQSPTSSSPPITSDNNHQANGDLAPAPAEPKSTSELFRSVYQDTLARHHTWWVRQAVSIASLAVPSREHLVQAIFANSGNSRDSSGEKIPKMSPHQRSPAAEISESESTPKEGEAGKASPSSEVGSVQGRGEEDISGQLSERAIEKKKNKEEGMMMGSLQMGAAEQDENEMAERFLACMRQVYDKVQRIYEEWNLLELP